MSDRMKRLDALLAAAAAAPEPAPEVDWDRLVRHAVVEGRARAGGRRRRRGWGVGLAVAAALLLGLVGGYRAGRGEEGLEPAAHLETPRPASSERPALSLVRLPTGDRIATVEGTALEVAELGATRRVHLRGGEAVFDVAPLGPGQGFEVDTPHGRARVLGTVFRVAVGAERTWVEVFEGRVEWRAVGRAPNILTAGEIVGETRSPGPPSPRFEAFVREALARRARSTEPVVDAPLNSPTRRAESRGTSLVAARRLLARRQYARVLEAAADPGAGSAVGWMVLEADAARALGQRDRAVRLMERALARSSPSEAARLGYQAARLHVEQGRPSAALGVLERSGALAPGAPLEERATVLQVRALSELGRPVGVVARRYLARFPDGSERDRMARRLAARDEANAPHRSTAETRPTAER